MVKDKYYQWHIHTHTLAQSPKSLVWDILCLLRPVATEWSFESKGGRELVGTNGMLGSRINRGHLCIVEDFAAGKVQIGGIHQEGVATGYEGSTPPPPPILCHH